MRIGIQSWGSEGDLRPFLALAEGLADRGHNVTFVATNIEDKRLAPARPRPNLVLRHVATPVVADPHELNRLGRACVEARWIPRQSHLIVRHLFLPAIEPMQAAAHDLARGSDLIIRHFLMYPATIAARTARVPELSVILAPNIVPSRLVCPTGLPEFGLACNALWWRLARLVVNRILLGPINTARAAARLPPARDVLTDAFVTAPLTLVAVSPVFCPGRDAWPATHAACGFLETARTAADPESPPALTAFLGAGPAPVYFTFGSLMPLDPAEHDATVTLWHQAVTRAGCRAIFQGRHPPPAAVERDPRIFVAERLSHHDVFPRCAAVVCHGGAGTTHAVARAGVPAVVVPHVADQLDWALALQRLGIAPPPLPRRSLTARALAERLESILTHPELAARALHLASQLRTETGVATACDLIEKHFR